MANLQSQIDELTKRIEKLEGSISRLQQETRGANKELGKTNNIFADILVKAKNIGVELKNFATSMSQQYQMAEELAEAYKKTSLNIGLAVDRSEDFGVSFIKATSKVKLLGGEMSDVQDIYKTFIEETGRSRIIRAEEVERMYALGKATGDWGNNTVKLFEQLELLGKGVVDSADMLDEIIVDSQKMGLNSSKVINTLSDNIKQMQTFSFRNGVRGMTEMAKLAVKMRLDVSSMLGMAEKFYEPEAAIEAAAQLQMLGGDIAEAFGDPFETMYLARNKPEELANRVSKMTENMIQFNKETGEYEFPAEARMQLKAAGDQLGLNIDQMVEMARQSAKIKDIKMDVSGNITDPEMREGIASMARIKDGRWVVDFEGKELGIDEIGEKTAEALLSAPKTAEDAAIQTAKNSLTMSETLNRIEEAGKLDIISRPGTNVYMEMEKLMKPSFEELSSGVNRLADAAGKTVNLTDMIDAMKEATETGGMGAAKVIEKSFDSMIALLPANLQKDLDEMKENEVNIINELDKLNKQIPTIDVTPQPTPDVTPKWEGDIIINNENNGNVETNINNLTPEQKEQMKEVVSKLFPILFKDFYNQHNGGVPD
jgi:uncharacterized protein YoxC